MWLANLSLRRLNCLLLMAFSVAVACRSTAYAVDGTWENPASGDYNVADNWVDNTIAGGVGATANFNSVDLNGDVSVTLNSDVTLGHLIFGDTNLASGTTYYVKVVTPNGIADSKYFTV